MTGPSDGQAIIPPYGFSSPAREILVYSAKLDHWGIVTFTRYPRHALYNMHTEVDTILCLPSFLFSDLAGFPSPSSSYPGMYVT